MSKLISGQIIILISLIISVFVLIFIISEAREKFYYIKIKKLESIEIIEDSETKELKMEKDEEKKIIMHYINKTYIGLEKLYVKNSWENKRFLYKILKSIDDLKTNVEFNNLIESDMEKINSIICIYRLGGSLGKNLEKIIFEWESRYIDWQVNETILWYYKNDEIISV